MLGRASAAQKRGGGTGDKQTRALQVAESFFSLGHPPPPEVAVVSYTDVFSQGRSGEFYFFSQVTMGAAGGDAR